MADASDRDGADEGAVIQRRDLHLEGRIRVDLGGRTVLDDGLEQRRHVAPADRVLQPGIAVDGRGVDDGEIQLLIGGAEPVEQIEDLIDDPVGTRAGAVDLVDDHDRTQPVLERLAGDEARLRHRAFLRVDQQQHRVDHREHALHLAAEVGVSGGVDDVDAVVVPADGGVLGEDGDAALLLQRVGVHHPLDRTEAVAERAGLLQELVDQCGFAMIDMGDDGDVAKGFDHWGKLRAMADGDVGGVRRSDRLSSSANCVPGKSDQRASIYPPGRVGSACGSRRRTARRHGAVSRDGGRAKTAARLDDIDERKAASRRAGRGPSWTSILRVSVFNSSQLNALDAFFQDANKICG